MKWWHLALPLSIAAIAWSFWKRRWIMAQLTENVPGTPESLAASAGYDVDLYSMARVGQSEESGIGSIAVMWATKNEAKRAKVSITKLVTRARLRDGTVVQGSDGFYGTQKHRFCATDHDPSSHMLELAGQIMTGAQSDITNGCHHWDNPSLQDRQHASDPDNHPSSEEIARRREASGWHMVIIDGVTKTRFWR